MPPDQDLNQSPSTIKNRRSNSEVPEIHIKTPSLFSYIQNYELNMRLSPHVEEPLHEEPSNVREKVYNFVKIPWEVEKVSFLF